MTTPDEPGERTAQPSGATSREPAPRPPAQPAAAPPQPDPFAPVPRPPKVPWVAPQRKGPAIVICAVAALVLLGGGVGIGAAAFGQDQRHGPVRFERPDHGQGPLPRFRELPRPPSLPVPSPSTSS